ncbi:hypothetical protein QUA13_02330 [Microcoleus sp. S28C3]|uniref:hypothetical protein n=1 Tax=Microcoleus sp. S28C3 TaxID=3055414 RepID=UPI002FCF8F6F
MHSQNTLLVEDATSLADSLSGEGIRPALFSQFNAAQAIYRTLGGACDAKEQYNQTIAQKWGTDMVWAGRLARAFYQFTGAACRAGVKLPIATQLTSKILCGELRYADIANRALKKLMPF